MSKSEKTMTGTELIATMNELIPKLPDAVYNRLVLGSFRVKQARRIFEEAGRLIVPGDSGRNSVVVEMEFRRKMEKIKREKLPEVRRSQANGTISPKLIAAMNRTADLLNLAVCVGRMSVRIRKYAEDCAWWSGFDLAMYQQQLFCFITMFAELYEDTESKNLYHLEEVWKDFLVQFQTPISDVADAMMKCVELIVKLMKAMVSPSGIVLRVAVAYLNSVPGFKDNTGNPDFVNKLSKLIEKYVA